MQILNIASSPPPTLRYFFLCDKITQRDDRQIDIDGLLSEYLFTDAPLKMPPRDITTTVVVGIHSEDRFRTFALRVAAEETGKDEVTLWNSQIGYINDQYSPVWFQRCDIRLISPGTYWFNIYLDGALAGRYPLTVEYMPMSDS